MCELHVPSEKQRAKSAFPVQVINQSLIQLCNIHKMNRGRGGHRACIRSVILAERADDNAAIGPPICIMDCSAERVVRSPLIQLSRSPMCRPLLRNTELIISRVYGCLSATGRVIVVFAFLIVLGLDMVTLPG